MPHSVVVGYQLHNFTLKMEASWTSKVTGTLPHHYMVSQPRRTGLGHVLCWGNSLSESKNKVISEIFWPRRDEICRKCRTLHNEELTT
jgi:hypothetical protein